MDQVPSFELLAHRIVWSLVFVGFLILAGKNQQTTRKKSLEKRHIAGLVASSIMIAINWLVFIWAINKDRILESSLGYYINPLFNVILGYVFLRERLSRQQKTAVFLALLGVLNLTVNYGHFPWVAMTLAGSFGCYGLLRKKIPVG